MNHYIYALTDHDGNPFYIGKTKHPKKRKSQHVAKAKRNEDNLPVSNKIRKLLREELNIGLELIESGLDESNVDEREQIWIKEYRRRYKIYNLAKGGEGGKGFTPEIIEKIRQTHLGSKRSDETKRKISKANKGRVFSEEHKRKLSDARKKRVISEETRRKTSESFTGRINIKKYKLIDPEGTVHITDKGLSDFCREHDLSPSNLCSVIRGERSHHKGWKIESCQ